MADQEGFFKLPAEIQNKILRLATEEGLEWTIGGGKSLISHNDLSILHTHPKLRRLAMPFFADTTVVCAATADVSLLRKHIGHEILKMIKSLSLHTKEYASVASRFNYKAAQKTIRSLDSETAALLPQLETLSIEIDVGYRTLETPRVDWHYLIYTPEPGESPKPYKTRVSVAHYADRSYHGYEGRGECRARRKWTLVQIPNGNDIEVERELTWEKRDGKDNNTEHPDPTLPYFANTPPALICCNCFDEEGSINLESTDANYCKACYMAVYCSYDCWSRGHRESAVECGFDGSTPVKIAQLHPLKKMTTTWASPEIYMRIEQENRVVSEKTMGKEKRWPGFFEQRFNLRGNSRRLSVGMGHQSRNGGMIKVSIRGVKFWMTRTAAD